MLVFKLSRFGRNAADVLATLQVMQDFGVNLICVEDGISFRFSWDMIPKTGLSTKDFIAPDSFDFRFSRLFRVGTTWGAASYLQILASELSDKLLAELLEMDAEMTITLHIQTVDQAAAVKSIKAKVSDIDKMKVEEQKKAARSGYDMDILPPDLVTYSNDAKTLLEDLQSRNERMFLLTFLVVNMAPTCGIFAEQRI